MNLRPKLHPARIVHRQHGDRCATHRGESPEPHSIKLKMIAPLIATRMKQRGRLARQRIDPREIRPLMQIAALARQRQIPKNVGAAVLPGYDVLDVVRKVGVFLREKTILAMVVRARAHKIARRAVHC